MNEVVNTAAATGSGADAARPSLPVERTPAESGARPRGWNLLRIGRWHKSSYAVAGALLAVLAFASVPGQNVVLVERDEASWEDATVSRFEHGWPLTWLARPNDEWAWYNPTAGRRPSCWTLWSFDARYRWPALAANLAVAAALALAAGTAAELWRRARARRWQLHVRDFFGLVFVAALPGAWYATARHRYSREAEIVGAPLLAAPFSYSEKRGVHGIQSFSTEPGGCTWMRELLGDERFAFLDRVTAVQLDAGGMAWAAQLPDVRGVEVNGSVTTGDLAHLAKLPRLELLDLNWTEDAGETFRRGAGEPSAPEQTVTLPPLPSLRSLSAGGVYCRGLANVPSLAVFNCSGVALDDPLLRAIGGKKGLRTLRLHQCAVEKNGLRHLAALADLTHLELIATDVPDGDLAYLASLTELRELRLSGSEFTGAGLAHLTPLSNLRTLELDAPGVGNDGIELLLPLRKVETLDLRHTGLTRRSVRVLVQMKQLQRLSVESCKFRREDRARLAEALPTCQIYFAGAPLPDEMVPE